MLLFRLRISSKNISTDTHKKPSVNPFNYSFLNHATQPPATALQIALPSKQLIIQPAIETCEKIEKIELSKEEEEIYGNRMIKGFHKILLLGKGGCAVVWKASKESKLYAIKQIARKAENALSNIQSLKIEFEMYNKIKKITHCGQKNIAEIYDIIEEKNDFWYVAELGGLSLGRQIFRIKGEFVNSERVYGIKHLKLHSLLTTNSNMIKQLLRNILIGLDLMQEAGIVHGDIKPENILVEYKDTTITDVKIIDLGSAFSFDKPSNIRMSTPEYLSPEALIYFGSSAFQESKNSIELCKHQKPWSYDMWSLGAIVLEIYIGFPLWLSLKGKICNNDYVFFSKGLFAVAGREGKKIVQLQMSMLSNLNAYLKKYHVIMPSSALNLLLRMMEFDPMKRISPKEALAHEFLSIQ